MYRSSTKTTIEQYGSVIVLVSIENFGTARRKTRNVPVKLNRNGETPALLGETHAVGVRVASGVRRNEAQDVP